MHPGAVIHVNAMEWTNDDALELIEQYRSHHELWNRSDPKYKDKLCRFRAWSEIADRFGCSKAEVERKMNVLLTQYRREKHKMLVKLYQGIQPNPSKWYAFKRFDFMEAGGGSASSGSRIGSSGSGGSTNGHGGGVSAAAAAAAAASLNGLASYDGAASAVAATTTSHHRRMKSKEMKYFGAMGLHLPMLITNTQTLDSWNTLGQFSPPIDRNHLRVPLPISFGAHNDSSFRNVAATRSLFSSSNSDLTASPQKPTDPTDIDEGEEKTERPPKARSEACSDLATGSEKAVAGEDVVRASSPNANANTREAHRNRHESHDQDELDIKQELVDFFHAPHPPAPPDSNRSYSSTDDNHHRLSSVGVDAEDFAQDLRVSAAAAAAAAAKGLDFSQFVLPPRNMRHSSESIEEKFAPLNMRKLNTTAANSAAGQMLMNSLLSNESTSEENMQGSGRGGKMGSGNGGGMNDTQTSASTSAAAAAAAALYAEHLNRDDCDFVGSNVSLKLRSMDRTQRIIAEKLIGEVLFYGQFSELERSARIEPK